MEFVYDLAGGAPVLKKLPIGETWNAYPGIPGEVPTATGLGIQMCETNGIADGIGVSVDATPATYSTTQSTDGSDIEALVTFVVNPLAVYRALLSGEATEGTALPKHTVTTASTDGLSVVCSGGTLVAASNDDGLIWGYTGANAGLVRFVEDATTTDATIVVPFHDVAVGDKFLDTTLSYYKNRCTLTTNLYQVVHDGADTGTLLPVDFELRDESGDGDTNSFVHAVIADHMLNLTSV